MEEEALDFKCFQEKPVELFAACYWEMSDHSFLLTFVHINYFLRFIFNVKVKK